MEWRGCGKFFLVTVILALVSTAAGQIPEKPAEPKTPPPGEQPAAQPCPRVEVLKPQQPVRDGATVKFRVTLAGGDGKYSPFYSWSISAGTVISGQGTASLDVDSSGAGAEKSITATVLVGGLPAECMSIDGSVSVYVAGPPQKVDEYGLIPDDQELSKLDSFIAKVTGTEQAYVIAYAAKSTLRGQANTDLRKIRAYLIKAGSSSEQIVTLDGGYREEAARELWIVPVGADPPKPTPTVNAKDVVFLKPPAPAPKKP